VIRLACGDHTPISTGGCGMNSPMIGIIWRIADSFDVVEVTG
jgi:hypothetical protein